MELIHNVWKLIMNGALCSDRVQKSLDSKGSFRRCLDLGTGTGTWAVDFADEWEAKGVAVVGNDLSPIQPRVSYFPERRLLNSTTAVCENQVN
jgi:SAM-dependent methyltransferase